MGFPIGPVYLGDIRCPKCNKVMTAVAGNRACPLGHAWASPKTKWKPELMDRAGALELLNNMVRAGYITQRNYKFAMQHWGVAEAKNLPGEAKAPPTNFKLFSDNDDDGEVAGLLKKLSSGVKKGLERPAVSKKKEAIENPEPDKTIPIEGPDNVEESNDG